MPFTPIIYADLEIRVLELSEERYPVEITFSGKQEFPRGYLKWDIVPWAPSDSPTEDGERLFELLFADAQLKRAWAAARAQISSLRIRLRIDASAPELHAIPWELLRESGSGLVTETLSADADTPFSRYMAGEWHPGKPVRGRPIKLLAVIANPANLADYGLSSIDAKVERQNLEAAVAGLAAGRLELTFLEEPATLSALEAELKRGYDFLHIIAHGLYNQEKGRAALFLADDENKIARVVEDDFAEMLVRQGKALRLIFLASCQTARRSSAGAFRGFAPKLVAAGVPAVVAMQDLVPVKAAQTFAATFYRRLFWHGMVDVAANEARSAMLTAGLSSSWAVPVLFSRVPEGAILPQPTTLLDATEHLTSTKESQEVSGWLFDSINKELSLLPPSLRANLRGPTEIGPIDGADADTRAANAAVVAHRHNATILIYGVVRSEGTVHTVAPEFYVSDPGFRYGSEVAGPNRLGQAVPFAPPLSDFDTLHAINKKLYARTKALRNLVAGLTYFYAGDYETATAKFRQAAAVEDWAPREGKEVVYLLIGMAKLRAYDRELDAGQRKQELADATAAFSKTYQINQDYARAYLGLGGVALAPAAVYEEVNKDKLIEASYWYSRSLSVRDQPASAYIPVKAAFGLGQVHLKGLQQKLPGWSKEQAEHFFTQVVEAYNARPAPDLIWFAGHAHASLGWLASYDKDWEKMSNECQTAIDILNELPSPPPNNWIARYRSWIGFAERKRNNLDTARDAYREAIRVGANAALPEELQEWQSILSKLEKGAP
jgi:hypothetical protein